MEIRPSDSIILQPAFQNAEKNLHPQDFEILKEILRTHEVDLAPSHGFFAKEDFDQISEKSKVIFFEKIKKIPIEQMDGETLRFLWKEILADFNKNYWGFKKHEALPPHFRKPYLYDFKKIPFSELPKKNRGVSSYKENFFYVWTIIQSLVIMKCLILIFGNELAKDDTPQNRIFFGAVMLFSFGSLFYFAWSKNRPKKP